MGEVYFSILIPVYNAGKFLEKCLDSVLNQTYNNYEVIIINDGSTDSSEKICCEHLKKDSRIRLFNQKNSGISKTRYQAMKKTKGEFTIFLDADDYLNLNFLEVVKKYIEDYMVDMVIFNYRNIDINNNFLFDGPTNFKGTQIFRSNKSEIYNKIFFSDEINALWRKVIKTSLIKLEDYLDYLEMSSAEDNMFSVPLLIRSKKNNSSRG